MDKFFKTFLRINKFQCSNVLLKNVNSYSTKVIDLTNKGSSLELLVADSNLGKKTLKFDPYWLIFNCHSPKSKQEDTHQIILDKDSIPDDLTIEGVHIEDKNLIIKWNKDSRQVDSILPIEFLVNNCPLNFEPSKKESRFKTSQTLAHFDYSKFFDKNGNKNHLEIFKWLKSIGEYGVNIVHNVGTEHGTVKTVAEIIAPVQNSIYGELFEVKVDKHPINIAYSSVALGFHIDLNYYESPPGLQFLHCINFDSQIVGGESLFLDSFEVAEAFRDKFPVDFENLTQIPATFQKIHFNRKRPVCMIYQRPHIVVNEHKQIIGVNWAPPFEGPLRSTDEKTIVRYHKSYLKFSRFLNNFPRIEYKLKPGEIACFNNRRFLHGRNSFEANDGSREFQGCYVNIDEFKSELLIQGFKQMKNLDEKALRDSKSYDIASMDLARLAFGNHDLSY